MKSKIKTIDATPTWAQTMNMLFNIIKDGEPEAKELARQELVSVGKYLDELTVLAKEQPQLFEEQ